MIFNTSNLQCLVGYDFLASNHKCLVGHDFFTSDVEYLVVHVFLHLTFSVLLAMMLLKHISTRMVSHMNLFMIWQLLTFLSAARKWGQIFQVSDNNLFFAQMSYSECRKESNVYWCIILHFLSHKTIEWNLISLGMVGLHQKMLEELNFGIYQSCIVPMSCKTFKFYNFAVNQHALWETEI